MGFYAFDGTMSSLVPVFIFIIFAIVIGTILVKTVTGVSQWSTNNNSPQLSVSAQVMTKRTNTWGGSGDSSAHTDYYVTFQVESGDRMEFTVKGKEYGLLAEGDVGLLNFQGTRYLGFERMRDEPFSTEVE